MTENKNSKEDKNSRVIDKWIEIYKIDHESFTFVEILEQITIVIGFIAFLAGFWYVFYRVIQSFIT